VLRALDEIRPGAVLVELPADCAGVLRWVADERLRPPVALLGYLPSDVSRAAFWPLAEFSPEWQALRWAHAAGVPATPIDVPMAWALAGGRERRRGEMVDPLGALAAAAGEPDAERWWEDVVEHRGDGEPAFDAVATAMAALRRDVEPETTDAFREAHMRLAIRAALGSGRGAVAVVCGAWHVPALDPGTTTATADRAVLRAATAGAGRPKAAVTWVPWTDRRLQQRSGYAAGVATPGWYRHVFRYPGPEGVARFFVDAATALRRRGLAASPDHLIAASRLADGLAAIRGRPRSGLAEVLDSASAVLSVAADEVVAGVIEGLTVGDAIGDVPDEAPQVPLARDVGAAQRAARLPPRPEHRQLELDLRTETGLRRSHLLHRLAALGVDWGVLEVGRSSRSTFRETWSLAWDPPMSVRVVECASYGTTLVDAATALIAERAVGATRLPQAAALVADALLADLPDAVRAAATALGMLAATAPDVGDLIDALVPLASALRYGDVRGSDSAALATVVDEIVVRVIAGLELACRQLDDDAAAAMVERLSGLQGALATLDHPARRGDLPAALAGLADGRGIHGLVRGRAARLLHDGGAWDADEVSERVGRALTAGTPAAEGARFVEGFLAGSGTVLLHDAELLGIVDGQRRIRRHGGVAAPHVRRLRAGGTPPARRARDGRRGSAGTRSRRRRRRAASGCRARHRAGHARAGTMNTVLLPRVSEAERLRRWRLVLGGGDGTGVRLERDDSRIDAALGAIYDHPAEQAAAGRAAPRRVGGLARSAPAVSRWLGDIRRYFPVPVVQVLQRDAVERFDLTHLLLEPELLAELEPDVHLVSVLVELNRLLPEETKDTARRVIAGVLDSLRERFADRTRTAVTGALARSARSRRPRPSDVDWMRTIRANLRHWLPEQRTVVPERLIGYGRRSPSLARDVVIAIDESGSMAASVVHASLFACLLARMPALRTSLIAFDTSVVDLTEWLDDPVEVLFGVQLGGGTDIGNAVASCQRLITRPAETLLVLVSDLFEGGDVRILRRRVDSLVRSGVTVLVLLALSDEGAPAANHHEAATLAALGALVATCTPDQFPDVLAAALEGRPLPPDVSVAAAYSD
jgi:uncharacterized protein (DUF2267 family)